MNIKIIEICILILFLCTNYYYWFINNTFQLNYFRLAELQADDFHLDRPLYFACRDDREEFCPKQKAGDGRIYKCLLKNKNERGMSKEVWIIWCANSFSFSFLSVFNNPLNTLHCHIWYLLPKLIYVYFNDYVQVKPLIRIKCVPPWHSN